MWTIVVFPEENSVEAVPVCWITDSKEECYWPPGVSSKINKKIANCEKPSGSWGLCKIRLLTEKEYDNLIIARRKAIEAQATSDIERIDTLTKRKPKRNRRIFNSSDSDSERTDGSSSLSRPPPTPPKDLSRAECNTTMVNDRNMKNKKCVQNSVILDENQGAISKNRSLLSSHPIVAGFSKKNDPSNISNQEEEMQNVNKKNYESTTVVKRTGVINSNVEQQCESCRRLLRTVNSINLKVEELINDFQRLCHKLDAQGKVATLSKLPLIYETFPINSVERLLEFEHFLEEKEENFNEFVNYLSNIGGDQSYECIKRCLIRILTDSVASQYNWLGLKNKSSFGKLNLTRAIIIAVQKNKQITEKQIEKDIKSWLKHAKERLTALEKHQNK